MRKAHKTRLEFQVVANESESAALDAACETYARGWRWGFEQQTLGLAETDWVAFRALQPEGYNETLYRGIRYGFQAAWSVMNQKAAKREPQNIVQSGGQHVRRDGAELLAFNATFATDPPIPEGFKVSSLRIERTPDGWRGTVTGRQVHQRKRRQRRAVAGR